MACECGICTVSNVVHMYTKRTGGWGGYGLFKLCVGSTDIIIYSTTLYTCRLYVLMLFVFSYCVYFGYVWLVGMLASLIHDEISSSNDVRYTDIHILLYESDIQLDR